MHPVFMMYVSSYDYLFISVITSADTLLVFVSLSSCASALTVVLCVDWDRMLLATDELSSVWFFGSWASILALSLARESVLRLSMLEYRCNESICSGDWTFDLVLDWCCDGDLILTTWRKRERFCVLFQGSLSEFELDIILNHCESCVGIHWVHGLGCVIVLAMDRSPQLTFRSWFNLILASSSEVSISSGVGSMSSEMCLLGTCI